MNMEQMKALAAQFECHAASQGLDQIEQAGWMMREAVAEITRLRGMARQGEPALLPNGWTFNHTQQSADDAGVWEIGALNEDDQFSAVITVDTGNYDHPQDAEPMARAILSRITA